MCSISEGMFLLCAIFSKHGLRITIEGNKKIVNFLDVTLNLTNGKYMPHTKPNNIPLYINKKSNHPSQIIKNIPKSINNQLSEISHDEESFNKAAPLYQKALDDSGHKHRLAFHPPSVADPSTSNRKNRHRDIIWYNPPYSKNVATNVGRAFLKILDKEFPKGNVLHKIFNRNTVKISYSCMCNVKQGFLTTNLVLCLVFTSCFRNHPSFTFFYYGSPKGSNKNQFLKIQINSTKHKSIFQNTNQLPKTKIQIKRLGTT